MNDFVVLDFVKLKERSAFHLTCGRCRQVYPVFQRFYSLWVESTGGKAEVCELYVARSVDEKVLRKCQSIDRT